MADHIFTRVTKDAESSYSLSPRQMALWQSQKEDPHPDWLRVVPISGPGTYYNGKAYRSVSVITVVRRPLFFSPTPCQLCFKRVFKFEDIYEDHRYIMCLGIIGIAPSQYGFRTPLSTSFFDQCVYLTGSSLLLEQTGMSDCTGAGVNFDAAQRNV
ncbi:hypothetical protein Tco_1321791, partial [Tanacetum coccineum]